jgi:carbamoyltransferase
MESYVLSFKPAIPGFGNHDPSAAIFEGGELVFGVEEERYTRQKHAVNTFPRNAIEACLDHCGIGLSNVSKVVLPYKPELGAALFGHQARSALGRNGSFAVKLQEFERAFKNGIARRFFPGTIVDRVDDRLAEIETPVPPIETREHHRCHAASAFYPSGQTESLVITIDGRGDHDSTVVWHGTADGLTRVRTWEMPNSLGHFFAIVTEFLGYRAFNGEGKVMGLAPYGSDNAEIDRTLRDLITMGVDYDVTKLTKNGINAGVDVLEDTFGRTRNDEPGEFNEWEQDLAYAAQKLFEEIVVDIVEAYIKKFNVSTVSLAGGVALNCKMNKRIQESDAVEELFIQPVAHDAGLALGGGWLESSPTEIEPMETVYWGPSFDRKSIEKALETAKLKYRSPDDLERTVAERLANGDLVGWFKGSLEMGPRALGHRSILADPRSTESRDRVNRYVKHREEWRPFAPSMLESATEEYLIDGGPSPYMIKTFDVKQDKQDEIPAVLHPADGSTRPHTVTKSRNERYYRVLSEFEGITGVPVILNTSFNDHAEPIVNRPIEAIKDFCGMGLDLLVLEGFLIEKL